MTTTIIQVSVLFILPIIIHNVLNDKAIARWLSPVVVCFIIGICAGTFIPENVDKALSSSVQQISIILAIPMLLMSSNFIKWLPKAKGVLFSFMVSCLSVLVAVLVAFFVFRDQTEHAWLISSMFLAGFTGTIANANAVGYASNCPEDILLLVNLGDMITGAVYLVFLISIAHPLLSKILPTYKHYLDESLDDQAKSITKANIKEEDFTYLSRYRMKKLGVYIAPIFISILILGITMGLEMILYPAQGEQGTFILLSVTVLGILSSLSPWVRSLLSSYRIGQYLLLVFCLALGSQIDFNEALSSSPLILTYAVLVMVIVIAMNIGLARIFKIDADTVMITSTSTIYGPAFIGQVAMAMKNKEIIFSGMIASMVGIALGNFLGIGLAYVLKALF